MSREEDIVTGNLRRSERLVVKTSRQESSETEREKTRLSIEEGRKLGWSGVTPPYLSEDTTVDYNHLGIFNSRTVTTSDSESEKNSDNLSEVDTTIIENTMASGGHTDDTPGVDPPRMTDGRGPLTIPRVPTRTTVTRDTPGATTGPVDVMSLMAMMMNNMREERQIEADRRDEERRKDREHDEKRWKELNRSVTPTDTTRTPQVSLPKLKTGDDIDGFITALETTLNIAKIPEDEWRTRLVSNIPVEAIVRLQSIVNVEETDYEGLKWALLGSNQVSFYTAAEDWCSGEKGKVFKKDPRAAVSRLRHLHKILVREAADFDQISEATAVAKARDNLKPECKSYIDLGKRHGYHDFILGCEEWVRAQPGEVSCFKQQRTPNLADARGTYQTQGSKPRVTCFSCGKAGHLARECRSRPPVAREVPPPTTAPKGREITCFRCGKKGHKSPDCPSRPKGNRRVQLPSRETLELQGEEVFGAVGGCQLCITVDTGAQITVVPKQCVHPDQFTGETKKVKSFQGLVVEGDACHVQFQIGGRLFDRDAVAVDGEVIHWTPCLRVPLSPKTELEFLMDLAEKNSGKTQKYVPPQIHQGKLLSGYLVSEDDVISHTTTQGVSVVDVPGIAIIEKEEDSMEESLGGLMGIGLEEEERSSVLCDEVEVGDHGQTEEAERGGCAVSEPEVLVEGIKGERKVLVKETKEDDSLKVAKGLADKELEGYSYKDGVLMRARIDRLGNVKNQICLPKPLREGCLSLAHSKFGLPAVCEGL